MKLAEYQNLNRGDFVRYSGHDHWGIVTEISADLERIRVVVLCERQLYMKDLKPYQVLEYWELVPSLKVKSEGHAAFRYLLEMCLSVAEVFHSSDSDTIIKNHNDATE